MNFIIKFIATVGFSGYSPKAPGTIGTIASIILLYFWQLNFVLMPIATLVALAVIVAIGLWTSSKMEAIMGEEDPQEVVIDEMAGMWITLLFIPFNLTYWIIGFILFRIFDIWKPWIIGKAQDLHGGMGIMLDDILAGAIANIILHLLIDWVL